MDGPGHMAKFHLLACGPINSCPLAMPWEDGPENWPLQALELGLVPLGREF